MADDEALRLEACEGVGALRPFSPLPLEGVFLWEPVGVVDGGGPSGSVVGVGLSARRLEAVFTPPNDKTTKFLSTTLIHSVSTSCTTLVRGRRD